MHDLIPGFGGDIWERKKSCSWQRRGESSETEGGQEGAVRTCGVREEWGGPSFFGWLAATVQQQQRTHIYERRQVAS
jgi:hypothetical protein